jgi:hypothetical protein
MGLVYLEHVWYAWYAMFPSSHHLFCPYPRKKNCPCRCCIKGISVSVSCFLFIYRVDPAYTAGTYALVPLFLSLARLEASSKFYTTISVSHNAWALAPWFDSAPHFPIFFPKRMDIFQPLKPKVVTVGNPNDQPPKTSLLKRRRNAEILWPLAERLQLPFARVAGAAGLQPGQVTGAIRDPGARTVDVGGPWALGLRNPCAIRKSRQTSLVLFMSIHQHIF